jgi:hypothetical protein
MAEFDKVNSDLIIRGEFYSTLQLKLFKIVTTTAVTSDTQDGTTRVITEGTARLVAQELGTTAALFEIAADGEEIVFVGDGHALDINSIARRVDVIVGGTGILTGAGTTAIVTVTEPESFASLMA